MTAAPSDPPIGSLAPAARELHRRHALSPLPARQIPSRAHLGIVPAWLDRARHAATDPPPEAAKAAEWLLDNDYLVLRAAAQIHKDLPPGFFARLPGLDSDPGRGLPRVYAVAHGFLHASRLQFSLPAAIEYVNAYQEGAPLTIAELWALPTMLRLACLEILTTALERLLPGVDAPIPLGLPETALDSLDLTECVARSVANLTILGSIPWREFFQETSHVEAVLRQDPAAVYARMNAETRDHYRREVEDLARGAGRPEPEVAERIVNRARSEHPNDPDERAKRSHVGFWIVSEGRYELERLLGYRPGWRLVASRWLQHHALFLHVLTLSGATAAALVLPAFYLGAVRAAPALWALAAAVVLLPATVVAMTVVHWAVTRIVTPRVLPKLDFDDGIPDECASAVVMPVLIGSQAEAQTLLDRLEGHYLTNPDPNLQFALLSDFMDAPEEHMPGDLGLLLTAVHGVRRLNERYGQDGKGPFHLLHRPRLYNPGEGVWMAWERKRGKLEEFNELVATGRERAFTAHEGDPAALRRTVFVVTLDADTQLLPGTLARLVGTLAHPLNRAQFDDATGRVRAGYTIIQPRVEIAPESGTRSPFARICSGDTSIDIYTRAVSNVYQDLFGVGIFVGKGIYDVQAFRQSIADRIPENALLSHDLFEGIHGRAGLASDVVLYEGFPSNYPEFAWRWHRWVRGDWSLLPWLFPKVPGRDGQRLPNPLSGFARWLILDNMRRSLLPAALVVLLVAGWLVLPGSPWVWTALAVFSPGAYLFTDLVAGLARVRGRRRGTVGGVFLRLYEHAGRWAVALIFLPQDAVIALDAILRALWRMGVSRRHLLEWVAAAHLSQRMAVERSPWAVWGQLWAGPVIALGLTTAVLFGRPEAMPAAAGLIVLWLASPEIAAALGRPSRSRLETLEPAQRAYLRRVARRTWLYFETFAGPEDHWLPPDNYQEEPGAEVAHRTSPTNVGMLCLSSLAAWDLGYVSAFELAARFTNLLETLGRLERHGGHWFNWYDTRTLAPLPPRYVSTVDSGNLAVSLLVMKEGCREIAAGPAFPKAAWDGLADELDIVRESLQALAGDDESPAAERAGSLAALAADTGESPRHWRRAVARLREKELPGLDQELLAALEQVSELRPEALHEARIWLGRVHHHLHAMERDLDTLLPWLPLLEAPPEGREELANHVGELLPPTVRLTEIGERAAQARDLVQAAVPAEDPADPWLVHLDTAIQTGVEQARELRLSLLEASRAAEADAWAMDFRLLYDLEARIFHIGYHLDADRMDLHRYDLLASEARLASFLAIAKRDVPVEHWFFLGRPVVRAPKGLALQSWSGSMFEYLMPPLVLRSHEGTLLGQSERAAVDVQRRYARQHGIPWGTSESGYAALNQERHYSYRAFGVPSLGLRRGLERDLVVAPYASLLAVGVHPAAVLENLEELEKLGMMGRYGFYEAADFTPRRVPAGKRFAPVLSYMAHHQGMAMAALGNALVANVMVRRFHADRRVRVAELLLQERVPRELPAKARPEERMPMPLRPPTTLAVGAWAPVVRGRSPEWLVLGNGRLSSWISESGGGVLRYGDLALTRWVPDATRDSQGVFVYVRDEESGAMWSVTRQPTGAVPSGSHTRFHPHLAEFHRRDDGVAIGMEIGVLPRDDAEARILTVDNESDRPREITLTSYGEVVLAPPASDERHPPFSKLFVGSEYLAGLRGLLFTRRPREPEERPPVLLHRVVADDPRVRVVGHETDRRAFLGRNGEARAPRGGRETPGGTVGHTLDPVASLSVRLRLAPRERRRFAFVTLVSGSRESLLELAERYATLAALEWGLADAATDAVRQMERLGLETERLPELSRLASLLVNPHPSLRSGAAVEANTMGQGRLWGLGLSGDNPILLLRASDPAASDLFQLLLRGHELWRRRGLRVDFVVLRTGASGYVEPLRDKLLAMVQEAGVREQIGGPGGVHFLVADQLAEGERSLIEASARGVLDDARGALGEQLFSIPPGLPELPAFQPTGRPYPEEPTPALERPADLLFDNGIGGFTPDEREYVIHLAPGETTPGPWANVLANDEFGSVVTEAGGGFTWAGNSSEHRLTPWSGDTLADPPSETLYLRDEETAAVWTPTPRPAGDAFACQIRHGAGYTEWVQRAYGLESRLRAFVPPDAPVKLVTLRLQNLWKNSRRLTATYYAEWLLGTLRSVARQFVSCEYEPSLQAVLARSPWNPEFAQRVAFLVSSQPPHGLTADRQEFLGREGDPRRPAGLTRWGLSDRAPQAADPCAAMQVHLSLAPEETVEVSFVLGSGRDRAHATELAREWRDPARIARGFADLTKLWDERLGVIKVKTPDPAFDLMTNRWLLYQAFSSRILARTGFHQPGGAIGFRDQLQDHLALLLADPARVRAHLLECAAHQFEEGDVLHWWHPPGGRGVRTRCSDDLLWLPYCTVAYVEATGDESILDEVVPFLRGPALSPDEDDHYAAFEVSPDSRSLFEHCERALERGMTRGAHGLPLMGAGDWNDGMSRVGHEGRGESVWLAWFAIATATGFARLAEKRGQADLAARWMQRSAELEAACETAGWDGEWYLRAFDDAGLAWGAASCDECRIDSVAQSWAVISGAAPLERAKQAVESVWRELYAADPGVLKLLAPPFDATPRDPGYIKAYPPGVRENGGQYQHAAVWMGWAMATLKDGERAKLVYDMLIAVHRAASRAGAEHYRGEPYAIAGDVGGLGPHAARAGWTWYTGSAAWAWRLGVERILGLRLDAGRLVLDPCLPPGWDAFEAEVRCPAGTIRVHVTDGEAMRAGEIELTSIRRKYLMGESGL